MVLIVCKKSRIPPSLQNLHSNAIIQIHMSDNLHCLNSNLFTFLFSSFSSLHSLCLPAMDLIYWKETERTGMVLTGLVVGLLSLFQLSIITVVSTVCLAVMCFTISVRIYYQLLYVLNWGDGEHPFK